MFTDREVKVVIFNKVVGVGLGPPFRGSAIPGVSHSVTVQWSVWSAVWRVTCPKAFTPSMCWHCQCTVGDINLVNCGPKTVHQKPKMGEFGTPKVW